MQGALLFARTELALVALSTGIKSDEILAWDVFCKMHKFRVYGEHRRRFMALKGALASGLCAREKL